MSVCRGVAMAKKVRGINKNFGNALYFSDNFLLPPAHTYFPIDFKEISSTILTKVGTIALQPPPHGHATGSVSICSGGGDPK